MTEPLQGEVYFWPAVKDNHPMGDQKVHRWAVVSRDVFNQNSKYVLACPITSYPPTALDIGIKATPHNRLNHDSSLLPRMITPILKEELTEPITRLPANLLKPVIDRLRLIIEV